MFKTSLTSCLLFFWMLYVNAQIPSKNNVSNTLIKKIEWQEPVFMYAGNLQKLVLSFKNANYDNSISAFPRYSETFKNEELISVNLSHTVYEPLQEQELAISIKSSEPTIRLYSGIENGNLVSWFTLVPLRRNPQTGLVEKLVRFQAVVHKKVSTMAKRKSLRNYAENSVLASGDWYKVGVNQKGVYKLSYSFLSSLGLVLENISASSIRVFGGASGMLPQPNNTPRIDDLFECAILTSDGGDDRINAGDFILFYGQGPNLEIPDTIKDVFTFQKNAYSDSLFYFINVNQAPSKQIQNESSGNLIANSTALDFPDLIAFEQDKVNVLKSGREWYGDIFDFATKRVYNFNLPDLLSNSIVKIQCRVMARSGVNSKFNVKINGINLGDINCSKVNDMDASSAEYGKEVVGDFELNTSQFLNASSIELELNYNQPSGRSIGYLNSILINYQRSLNFSGQQYNFRTLDKVSPLNTTAFQINSTAASQTIWNVTNALEPTNISFSKNANNIEFIQSTETVKEFVIFSTDNVPEPKFHKKISNQNLHAMQPVDMIILSHEAFYDPNDVESPASKYAEFKKNHDGFTVKVVTPTQIYNEFSAGREDVSAIRDFMKMLYDRSPGLDNVSLKYLLLIGDASYDYKDILPHNTNYVPTYQAYNSLIPTRSFCSDDYFGFLDDSEGQWTESTSSLADLLDIGIGRFPVANKNDALGVVNKNIHYVTNNKSFGDWRNVVTFIADDEDGNTHDKIQANVIAESVVSRFPSFNVEKIYLGAYPQIPTTAGERAPQINLDIISRINKGSLIINYTGHGGEVGLAHERVIETTDIKILKNFNNLPLFVTATCEFSRYDDPDRVAAGEWMFLNPIGGGVALASTTRVVYSNENFLLNKGLFEYLIPGENDSIKRLGDIFKDTKNKLWGEGQGTINNRNFTILGDPSLQLSYPREKIYITGVYQNGDSLPSDTINALCSVKMKGEMRSRSGEKITSFTGQLSPAVYEKKDTMTTLGQKSAKWSFSQQKNIIHKGLSSVTNGEFEFNFIVPKDISYVVDYGKVSLYAANGSTDASGFFPINIGGTCSSITLDNEGPKIELFLNDESFINGGLTNDVPTLYAKIQDMSGLNTVGTGIGHEVTAILDGNSSDIIILNDFYKAKLDDYTSGEIVYTLPKLSPGQHKIQLRVWDVHNNPSRADLEFIVKNSEEFTLEHVLNYPNPFSTSTEFSFDHNRFGEDLEVMIDIFTISGKRIMQFNRQIYNAPTRIHEIYWNGKDEFGGNIGRGVYIYNVRVRSMNDGAKVSEFQKLVILK